MSTIVIDGVAYPTGPERRAGLLLATVARSVVPAGTAVLLDGVPYVVAASRDPYEPGPVPVAADTRVHLNDDARRRAESAALAAAEAKVARARAQMGKFCELELTDGLV